MTSGCNRSIAAASHPFAAPLNRSQVAELDGCATSTSSSIDDSIALQTSKKAGTHSIEVEEPYWRCIFIVLQRRLIPVRSVSKAAPSPTNGNCAFSSRSCCTGTYQDGDQGCGLQASTSSEVPNASMRSRIIMEFLRRDSCCSPVPHNR